MSLSPQINIGSFQGILGDVEHSTVSQHLSMDARQGDFDSLRSYLKSLKIPDVDIEGLRTAIEEDAEPKDARHLGERVGGWIGKMVGKAASGALSISTSVAANLLAASIRRFYGLP